MKQTLEEAAKQGAEGYNIVAYINMLESLKRELIKAERYEDVEGISKFILID